MTTSTLPTIPKNYYARIGVAKTANADEIKKTYRRLARTIHPDVNPDPMAEEWFKALSQAYEVLSDPVQRKEYDLGGEKRVYGRTPAYAPNWSPPPYTEFISAWTGPFMAEGLGSFRPSRPSTWKLNRLDKARAAFGVSILTLISVFTGYTWPFVPHSVATTVHVIAVTHHVMSITPPAVWIVLAVAYLVMEIFLTGFGVSKSIVAIAAATAKVTPPVIEVAFKLLASVVKLGVVGGFWATRLVRRLKAQRASLRAPSLT